jgi:hypothetical protein
MLLTKKLGTYSKDQIELVGSFQLGNPPTVFRDGTNAASAKKMFSVSHTGTGLYTVQFSTTDKYPIPVRPFIKVQLEQAAAPTADAYAFVVKNSWSQVNRNFQIQVQTIGSTPAATDGDAGDRISFWVQGAISSVGTDPA